MWGTKEYFAPELIDQAYGPQADLWALGCILFEMLCGHQGALSKSHPLPSFVSAFLSVSAFVYLTGSFSASIYLVDRICSQHPHPLFLCSRPSPLPKRFLSARGTTKTPSTEEYRRENTTSRGKPSHFPSLMLTAFLPVRLALHTSSSLSLLYSSLGSPVPFPVLCALCRSVWKKISSAGKDLVSKLLTIDPIKR